MKKLALFLLIIIFSQSFSQETDCEKIYREAQENFEKNFGDSSSIDYSGLGKTILENLDMRKFTEKYVVLYVSNVTEYCPSGVPKNPCPIFKDSAYIFNEERLWTSDHILALCKKTKKDIIPMFSQNFFTKEDNFYNYFKIKDFRKGIQKVSWQINDSSELARKGKTFYYFPYIYNTRDLVLTKISTSNVFLSTDTIQTIIHHPNSKEVNVNFVFENDTAKNYAQTYSYIDNVWKLTDSKNGNFN
jgi:hypothetical protein